MRFSLLSLALAGPAFAQIAEYGQCGGIGYTGDTTCASDLVCCSLNDWYSQCVEASSCSTTASATSTTDTTTIITSTASATATPGTGATGGFKWFGMDESVAEWGTNIPGTWGVDFYFPSTTAIGVSHKFTPGIYCSKLLSSLYVCPRENGPNSLSSLRRPS